MTSDQPALLQIILVDLDVGLASTLPAGQESLDVLADEIGFQVHGFAHLLDPERRDLGRVRNDGDAESSIGHLVEGQADPVDRDRPFRHAIAQDLAGGFNHELKRIRFLGTGTDGPDRIHMAGHQVSAKAVTQPHGPLEVHWIARFQGPQGGDFCRFGRDVRLHLCAVESDHGQAYAVHRHTVSHLQALEDSLRQDRDAAPLPRLAERPDDSHFLYDAGEHPASFSHSREPSTAHPLCQEADPYGRYAPTDARITPAATRTNPARIENASWKPSPPISTPDRIGPEACPMSVMAPCRPIADP